MASNYTIVDQIDEKVPDQGGRYIDGTRVVYETIPSGIHGSILVAHYDYTPERVAAKVAEAAANAEAIRAL